MLERFGGINAGQFYFKQALAINRILTYIFWGRGRFIFYYYRLFYRMHLGIGRRWRYVLYLVYGSNVLLIGYDGFYGIYEGFYGIFFAICLLLVAGLTVGLATSIQVRISQLWRSKTGFSTLTYPGFWKAFSWLLPRKIRKRVFDPAYDDLILDYREMPWPTTKLGKAYRHFVFGTHTILLVVDTLRATAAAKIFDLVVGVFRTPRT